MTSGDLAKMARAAAVIESVLGRGFVWMIVPVMEIA